MAYRAAIAGASGYTGAELLRLLEGHPGFSTTVATSREFAGRNVADVYPNLGNLIAPNPVVVYDFNGVAGDNFRLYFTQQAANFVLPQTVVDPDTGITRLLGSPVAGLTNAQNWAQYGIAFAGEIAPPTATTRDHVLGLVVPI